jgi:uncharacterized repeat protein (TIGR01451 family)
VPADSPNTNLPVHAGEVYNEAIATGVYGETTVDDTDNETVKTRQMPDLTLVKLVNGEDEITVSAPGNVTYTFEVTNTGDITLHDVVVVDEMLDAAGVEIPAIGTLAPGESKLVTATYTVTDDDMKLKKIRNTAYATDGEIESEPDTATVKVYHPKPKPEPTPVPTEPAKPAPVTQLPSTGSGTGSQIGLWMYAATGAAILAAGALGLRAREER